jgi:hypothetical protein
MGFEAFRRKPAFVRGAMKASDHESLSAMGKKGAEAKNRNWDLKKASDEYREEMAEIQKQLEEQERITSANEHIIDPDGNDLDYTDIK